MLLQNKYDYKFFMSKYLSFDYYQGHFMFKDKCMHLFSKTKCIFKYKCMHAYARGYGIHFVHKFYKEAGLNL